MILLFQTGKLRHEDGKELCPILQAIRGGARMPTEAGQLDSVFLALWQIALKLHGRATWDTF